MTKKHDGVAHLRWIAPEVGKESEAALYIPVNESGVDPLCFVIDGCRLVAGGDDSAVYISVSDLIKWYEKEIEALNSGDDTSYSQAERAKLEKRLTMYANRAAGLRVALEWPVGSVNTYNFEED